MSNKFALLYEKINSQKEDQEHDDETLKEISKSKLLNVFNLLEHFLAGDAFVRISIKHSGICKNV